MVTVLVTAASVSQITNGQNQDLEDVPWHYVPSGELVFYKTRETDFTREPLMEFACDGGGAMFVFWGSYTY